MKKYVFVKQLDSTDCGPACVSMLLDYMFDLKFTIGELKNVVYSNANGCTFLGIKKGLEKLGIKSIVYKCENDISIFNEAIYPFLTQISTDTTKHFIVVYGRKKDKLIVGDPSKNRIEYWKLNNLMKIWQPYILQISKEVDETKFFSYKNRDKKPSLYRELWNVRWLLLLSWIISIITYLLSIYLAGMYTMYFDLVIPNKYIGIILNLLTIYLTVLLFQLLLNYINSKIRIKMNNKIDKKLITRLISSFFSKNFAFIETYQSGEIITRFSNISQIRSRMLYIVQTFPLDIFKILFTFFLLSKTNVYLSMLIFIPMIIFALLLYFSHDHIENLSYKLFEQSERLNVALIESIDNIETLKNNSVIETTELKIRSLLDKLLKTSESFFSFDMLQTYIKNTIISMFNVLIFSFGSYLVINDNIASGVLLMFNSLAMNVFNPFLDITTLQATLEQGKVARLRYEDIVNTEIIENRGSYALDRIENIELKNVSFAYGVNNNVLSNINMKIGSGENVAIIGNSGSGKSTLAKLLAHYYDTTDGVIYINGIPYNEFDILKMKDKILYSPQSIRIFSDTILNNILMSRDIAFEEVVKLSKITGFHEVVESFPEGYNTKIGVNGVTLSIGQTQLLNIIRSTLVYHELIIFDEVTNGLDLILRERVSKFLLNYGNIKIFITHDIDFALNCDKIYLIINGGISKNLKGLINSKEDVINLLEYKNMEKGWVIL